MKANGIRRSSISKGNKIHSFFIRKYNFGAEAERSFFFSPFGLDSSRHVKILRKTTTFFSLKDMFRQNFCHLQLNGKLQSKLNVK